MNHSCPCFTWNNLWLRLDNSDRGLLCGDIYHLYIVRLHSVVYFLSVYRMISCYSSSPHTTLHQCIDMCVASPRTTFCAAASRWCGLPTGARRSSLCWWGRWRSWCWARAPAPPATCTYTRWAPTARASRSSTGRASATTCRRRWSPSRAACWSASAACFASTTSARRSCCASARTRWVARRRRLRRRAGGGIGRG